MDIEIRKATPQDSAVLAELMNMAGDDIPAWLWSHSAEPGEDVMAFGARRVARADGGFSYRNAHVAVRANAVAGMLLGYRLPDTPESGAPEDLPPVVRPLVALEALASGSWYINAVAVLPRHRDQGIGNQLMQLAETMTVATAANTTTLIVAEENRRALALYRRLDYETVARRPVVQYPACPYSGDYVLMEKRF